ncbi:MAG: TonB-dependent receptor [Betaproteobacteria bacterium]|nr:TonB-dependent receptor [Betaproteobacteria bacterium]
MRCGAIFPARCHCVPPGFLTQQDTAETRANTTAVCLSSLGTVRCLRETALPLRGRRKGPDRHRGGRTALVRSRPSSRRRSGILTHSRQGDARWSPDQPRYGRRRRTSSGEALPTRDFPVSDTDRFGAFAQDSFVAADPPHLDTRYPGWMRSESGPARLLFLTGNSWSSRGLALRRGFLAQARPALSRKRGADLQRAQIATGFRAPPAADLNIGLTSLPSGYTVVPNPDLQPETSRGIELGARFKAGSFEAMVTGFHTRYSDLIVSRAALPCPADPRCVPGATGTFQSQNVSSARIYGAEAKAAWRFANGWTARAALSIPRGDDIGKNEPLNAIDPARLSRGRWLREHALGRVPCMSPTPGNRRAWIGRPGSISCLPRGPPWT